MYLAANTALVAATATPMDTISYDPNGNCTTGAGAKYTVPVDGYYLVIGQLRANANTNATIGIYKNGVIVSQGVPFANAASVQSWTASDIIKCLATDTLDLRPIVAGFTTTNGGTENYVTISFQAPA